MDTYYCFRNQFLKGELEFAKLVPNLHEELAKRENRAGIIHLLFIRKQEIGRILICVVQRMAERRIVYEIRSSFRECCVFLRHW